MKYIFIFILFINIPKQSFTQDKLVLNNDSVIAGRVISADSSQVEIRKAIRPNGPDYIFRRKEIKKVDFENGRTVYYPHYFTEISLGLSTSFVYHHDDNIGSEGIHHFDNKLLGASFIVRDRVMSMRFESGYAWLYKTTTVEYRNHYTGFSSYEIDTLDENTYFLFLSLRANLSRNKINPYFFVSIGWEHYRLNNVVNDIENTRLGLGLQYRFAEKYIVETELGINIWNEDVYEYNEYPGLQFYSYFGLNIYRVIGTYYH